MSNKSDTLEILEKIKSITLERGFENRMVARKMGCVNFLKKSSLISLFLSVFIFILSLLINGESALFLNQSSLVFSVFSLVFFVGLFVEMRSVRKVLGILHEGGFFMQDHSLFQSGLHEGFRHFSFFQKFDRRLIELALIQYRNKWVLQDGLSFLFSSSFVVALISFFSGSWLSYIFVKHSNEVNRDGLLNLIFNNPETSFPLEIMIFYCLSAIVYGLNKLFDESMGNGKRQRREYVISLLECVIRQKSETK